LSWKIVQVGVHNQLWQKRLWKETKEMQLVDYPGAVGENN
jgi:hypothetical protein